MDEVIEVARRFGRDPEFARGGGGNASVKIDGVLYIKPSGVALATLAADDLVPLDMEPLLALLHAGDSGAEDGPAPVDAPGDPARREAPRAIRSCARRWRPASPMHGGRRPSVELLFHTLLPERLVMHTHPIDINAVTCNRDGEALADRLFGDRALWVPYTDPGLPLARAIVEARRSHVARVGGPAPAITIMQNHGIIVGGDSAAEIIDHSGWLLDKVPHGNAPCRRPLRHGDGGSFQRDTRRSSARGRFAGRHRSGACPDARRRDQPHAPRAPGDRHGASGGHVR